MAVSQAPARGRPRDHRIDQAVSNAAAELFRERGYSDASLIEIARRAKVGTPALYRRWRSKSALALDLITGAVVVGVPDSGDIRSDLTGFVLHRIRTFGDPLYTHLLLALATIAVISPDVAAALRSAVGEAQRPMLQRLEQARDRGELPADVDCEQLLNLAVGAVAMPMIFTGRNRSESEAAGIVAAVFNGLVRPAS